MLNGDLTACSWSLTGKKIVPIKEPEADRRRSCGGCVCSVIISRSEQPDCKLVLTPRLSSTVTARVFNYNPFINIPASMDSLRPDARLPVFSSSPGHPRRGRRTGTLVECHLCPERQSRRPIPPSGHRDQRHMAVRKRNSAIVALPHSPPSTDLRQFPSTRQTLSSFT